MICPVDQAHTETRSIYLKDRQLDLEQCPICLGIWVSRDRLDFLTEANVETIDTGSPPVARYGHLRCPVDATTLAAMPELTNDISQELYGCPSCHGVWFLAGQLRNYVGLKRQQLGREVSLAPSTPLRSFVAGSLSLAFVALTLALAGFRFGGRITAQGSSGPSPVADDLKLGLWFLVFAELAVWPVIFARDLRVLRAGARHIQLLSYFWLVVVMISTLVTFVITQL